MKKRICSFLAAIALIACLLPLPAAAEYAGFRDVDPDDGFALAVDWALKRGVTQGVTPDLFGPEDICTRGHVVTFLWRAKGMPEPKMALEKNPFEDVAPGSYYEKAVLWAVEQGITYGKSETAFAPDTECNYGEIITFLWRANGRPEPFFASPMTEDWPDTYYYKDAVTWGDNTAMFEDLGGEFDPTLPCTRATTVSWLYRDAVTYVSDVEHLIQAIGSGREIYVDPGTYNLEEWADTVGSGDYNDTIRLEYVGDGYEVQIRGVSNMSIQASRPSSGTAEIVTEPRYANVLAFYDCDEIYLDGLTVGHTPEQGVCSGGVLLFEDCGRIAMSNMDLYGCGTYGISAYNVESIQTVDTIIHDCTYGLLDAYNVESIGFADSLFCDCEGYTMLDARSSNLYFQNCAFQNLSWGDYSSFISNDEYSYVYFGGCGFDLAAYRGVINHARFNVSVFCEEAQLLDAPKG